MSPLNEVNPFGKCKTRAEFAEELGMSVRSLRRKLAQNGLNIPSGMLSPE